MVLLPTSSPANFSTTVMYGAQNQTNTTHCPHAEKNEWHSTVLPHYILVISVLGILLNVFVLGVFCFHKKPCSVAEIFLSNMAAADLILMAFMPFWAVYTAKGFNWPFPNPLCTVVTLSINMNAYCSIYFLVLISIDRYVALVHPLSHDGIRRPKYAKLCCVLVWCFGLLLSVPTLVYRKVKLYSNSYVCQLKYPNGTVRDLFSVMLIIFSFVIPISIISFCTFRIIQALNSRLSVASNTKKKEQKATTLMLTVLLAFMICWVPFHLHKIVQMLVYAGVITDCTLLTIYNICLHIFMNLAFFNSVLNPVLYVMVGKNFRKKVRELFQQRSTNTTLSFNTTYAR
uniref:B2 bradykinin receptor-like n=1 Tax=Gasterosteus aculeatus aculeatus TaxID=481459 RepID=UPI001A9A0C7A|nr:B2 bradykinin receptor-like [Gasterosteus aculeatus aculeatus]